MAIVFLRPVVPPTDYVLWDGTNISEVQEYLDPTNTSWRPAEFGTNLVLTGSQSNPLAPAPVYTLPANSFYIHKGISGSVLTLVPVDQVGWSLEQLSSTPSPASDPDITLAF